MNKVELESFTEASYTSFQYFYMRIEKICLQISAFEKTSGELVLRLADDEFNLLEI